MRVRNRRKLPQTFVCKGCKQTITLAPPPATDLRTKYCSRACKLRVFKNENSDKLYYKATCSDCGGVCSAHRASYSLRSLRCAKCALSRIKERAVSRKAVLHECAWCKLLKVHPGNKTCSRSCTISYRASLVKGRKFKPYKPSPIQNHVCSRCSKAFTSTRATVIRCKSCVRRLSDPTRGKPEARARRAGVPYVRGIKPEQVFARDGYRCHLCGCSTPKRLRGKNQPTSPEVDHIVPLSAGGGHVWDNVACACRTCNIRKSSKPLGQLRLAV